MGCPSFTSKNAPCHEANANPNYVPHPQTKPTHQPKQYPDAISRFSTIHWTDSMIDRDREINRPTDGPGDKTCTNTC